MGQCPVYGEVREFQTDPRCHDHLMVYDYFRGDNERVIGGSHHTGWTGMTATPINLMATGKARNVLGKAGEERHADVAALSKSL